MRSPPKRMPGGADGRDGAERIASTASGTPSGRLPARVHDFINESEGPMAMIWVCTGRSPIRIVVDERGSIVVADPWCEDCDEVDNISEFILLRGLLCAHLG